MAVRIFLVAERILPLIYFHHSDPPICKSGPCDPSVTNFWRLFHNNNSYNKPAPRLSSPLLHLQWFFLFSALVHRGLRVDAARWRSALAHLLFASFGVGAPSLRLPPLCSAVLEPNLHKGKKK